MTNQHNHNMMNTKLNPNTGRPDTFDFSTWDKWRPITDWITPWAADNYIKRAIENGYYDKNHIMKSVYRPVNRVLKGHIYECRVLVLDR